MNSTELEKMRVDYRMASLDESDALTDPAEQFRKWMRDAVNAALPEPNAMILATCDGAGKPSARVVLLKGMDERGLVFYTNYQSKKGHELETNPYCALVFNWLELQRQVRVEGAVEKISREESELYFHSRPRGSQFSGAVSPQSQVIQDKTVLLEQIRQLEADLGEQPVPVPEQWGGYLVKPHMFEFWQGRPSRFHDRIVYHRHEQEWVKERLAP